MSKDVYEMDNGNVNDGDDFAREMAIEHVREQPSFLKALKLEEYVADKKLENKKETLKDIKRELIHGFQDPRKQYTEPNQDEEFYMVSGESEETLTEGKIVQATVRRVQDTKAICALESGLTGILTKEDYADDWRDIVELSDRLHEGDTLNCKIKSIMKNRYQVFLVYREMKSNRYQQVQEHDPYYQEGRISLQNEQDKARKEKELAKKHFKPRLIIHPCFQNITADEAIKVSSYLLIKRLWMHPQSVSMSLYYMNTIWFNKFEEHQKPILKT